MTILSVMWGLVALYQAGQDARNRLLPYGATLLATLIGTIGVIITPSLDHFSVLVWHGIGGLLLLLAGLILWWFGTLGMGDVATFGCFGLIFGLVPAAVLIALSYGFTVVGVGFAWAWRRRMPTNIPLGIALWGLAIPGWAVLVVVAPAHGIII